MPVSSHSTSLTSGFLLDRALLSRSPPAPSIILRSNCTGWEKYSSSIAHANSTLVVCLCGLVPKQQLPTICATSSSKSSPINTATCHIRLPRLTSNVLSTSVDGKHCARTSSSMGGMLHPQHQLPRHPARQTRSKFTRSLQ